MAQLVPQRLRVALDARNHVLARLVHVLGQHLLQLLGGHLGTREVVSLSVLDRAVLFWQGSGAGGRSGRARELRMCVLSCSLYEIEGPEQFGVLEYCE